MYNIVVVTDIFLLDLMSSLYKFILKLKIISVNDFKVDCMLSTLQFKNFKEMFFCIYIQKAYLYS